jgi:hypothetical protein
MMGSIEIVSVACTSIGALHEVRARYLRSRSVTSDGMILFVIFNVYTITQHEILINVRTDAR